MMVTASKGHFLTQIPQPMHSCSDIVAILIKKIDHYQNFDKELYLLTHVKDQEKQQANKKKNSDQ